MINSFQTQEKSFDVDTTKSNNFIIIALKPGFNNFQLSLSFLPIIEVWVFRKLLFSLTSQLRSYMLWHRDILQGKASQILFWMCLSLSFHNFFSSSESISWWLQKERNPVLSDHESSLKIFICKLSQIPGKMFLCNHIVIYKT